MMSRGGAGALRKVPKMRERRLAGRGTGGGKQPRKTDFKGNGYGGGDLLKVWH